MVKSHFHPGQASQAIPVLAEQQQQQVFYGIYAQKETTANPESKGAPQVTPQAVCRAYQTTATSVTLQQWDAATGHMTHDVRSLHGDWMENEVVTCIHVATMSIQAILACDAALTEGQEKKVRKSCIRFYVDRSYYGVLMLNP